MRFRATPVATKAFFHFCEKAVVYFFLCSKEVHVIQYISPQCKEEITLNQKKEPCSTVNVYKYLFWVSLPEWYHIANKVLGAVFSPRGLRSGELGMRRLEWCSGCSLQALNLNNLHWDHFCRHSSWHWGNWWWWRVDKSFWKMRILLLQGMSFILNYNKTNNTSKQKQPTK